MTQEEQLITSVLSGNQADFNSLVVKYQGMAYSVALRILKNEADAEEAAQDAFVKAYRHLSKFDQRSKFSTWLYRIVSNEALSRVRKKKLDQTDIDAAQHIGDESKNGEENKYWVRAAINQLADKDAELLTLFYLKEFSLDEIGKLLEISTNNVKVGVHRARQRLAIKMHQLLGNEVYDMING